MSRFGFLLVWMVGVLVFVLPCQAQRIPEEQGFELGFLTVRPEVQGAVAYDNRVLIDESDPSDPDAIDDVYAEGSVAVYLDNQDARYNINASGLYGYRTYNDLSEINDDFHEVNARLSSDQNALRWSGAATYAKTLDYDTTVNPAAGRQPASVLTDATSRRFTGRANVDYERSLTDKISVQPGYEGLYYFQDIEDEGDSDWHEHTVGVQLGYAAFDRTVLTLSGEYAVQISTDDEDGTVAAVLVGVKGRSASEKTRWEAAVGISHADYDQSGSDEGVVSRVRSTWQATDKVSGYVFGGNDYQPGFNGGAARLVYRLGYGTRWNATDRWSFNAEILHNYEDSVGSGTPSAGADEVQHFVTARTAYQANSHLSLSASGRFVNDQEDEDQFIGTLRTTFRF